MPGAVEQLLATARPEDIAQAAARLIRTSSVRRNPAAARPQLSLVPTPSEASEREIERHADGIERILREFPPEAILVAARRLRLPKLGGRLTSGWEAYRFAVQTWPDLVLGGHERAVAVGLDAGLRVRKTWEVSSGGVGSALVPGKRVFAPALDPELGISQIVLFHGHPSGDPQPSQDDKQTTLRLEMAAALLELKLADHIIVGDGRFYSFTNERGIVRQAGRE